MESQKQPPAIERENVLIPHDGGSSYAAVYYASHTVPMGSL